MTRDPRHDILFEPVRIGPVTAKNRVCQVPPWAGMGWQRPRIGSTACALNLGIHGFSGAGSRRRRRASRMRACSLPHGLRDAPLQPGRPRTFSLRPIGDCAAPAIIAAAVHARQRVACEIDAPAGSGMPMKHDRVDVGAAFPTD